MKNFLFGLGGRRKSRNAIPTILIDAASLESLGDDPRRRSSAASTLRRLLQLRFRTGGDSPRSESGESSSVVSCESPSPSPTPVEQPCRAVRALSLPQPLLLPLFIPLSISFPPADVQMHASRSIDEPGGLNARRSTSGSRSGRLFSSFRVKKEQREPSGGSEEAPPSPRRFLGNFRPRSKSESKRRTQYERYSTAIPSVTEGKEVHHHSRNHTANGGSPLFVRTASPDGDQPDRLRRSPMSQMAEFVRWPRSKNSSQSSDGKMSAANYAFDASSGRRRLLSSRNRDSTSGDVDVPLPSPSHAIYYRQDPHKKLREVLNRRRTSDNANSIAEEGPPKDTPRPPGPIGRFKGHHHTRSNSSSPLGWINGPKAKLDADTKRRSLGAPVFFPEAGTSHSQTASMLLEKETLVYSQFMKAHRCYDLIPTSTKVLVFDTELPVRKAFFALVYNGVRAAPLWDAVRQEFVGMLTITDFIRILHKYYKAGQKGIQELEEHKIASWRETVKAMRHPEESESPKYTAQLISIDPSERLHKAVQTLCHYKVHRLPVVDRMSGNVLYILTHKRILRFLFLYLNDLPRPGFLEKTPKELGIGTWEGVETVTPQTRLIEALEKFLTKRVSALPVVDANGKVVDIYAKFDVINLAADKAYNDLDITVTEALKHRSDWFEGVRSCSASDSLWRVMEALVKAEVHRMLITNADGSIAGLVSLSDILSSLVLRPELLPSDETE